MSAEVLELAGNVAKDRGGGSLTFGDSEKGGYEGGI